MVYNTAIQRCVSFTSSRQLQNRATCYIWGRGGNQRASLCTYVKHTVDALMDLWEYVVEDGLVNDSALNSYLLGTGTKYLWLNSYDTKVFQSEPPVTVGVRWWNNGVKPAWCQPQMTRVTLTHSSPEHSPALWWTNSSLRSAFRRSKQTVIVCYTDTWYLSVTLNIRHLQQQVHVVCSPLHVMYIIKS